MVGWMANDQRARPVAREFLPMVEEYGRPDRCTYVRGDGALQGLGTWVPAGTTSTQCVCASPVPSCSFATMGWTKTLAWRLGPLQRHVRVHHPVPKAPARARRVRATTVWRSNERWSRATQPDRRVQSSLPFSAPAPARLCEKLPDRGTILPSRPFSLEEEEEYGCPERGTYVRGDGAVQ